MTQTDTRPANCRFRLQDENKPYPRSGCPACGRNISTGLVCPRQTPMPSMTQVTDADREAAVSLIRTAQLTGLTEYLTEIEDGCYDENFFVQAFAQAREQAVQEAVAPLNARIAELEATAQNCPARHSMHGCPLAMIAAAKDQTL